MDSRLVCLLDSTKEPPLVSASPPQLPLNIHSPSQEPIPQPSQEPQQLQQLVKKPSNPANTGADCLNPVMESGSPSFEKSQPFQGNQVRQQKSAKNQQQEIQSDPQISNKLNQNIPHSYPSESFPQPPNIDNFQFPPKKQPKQGSPSKKRKSMKPVYYDEEQNSEDFEGSAFKFPFVNKYLRDSGTQYLKTLQMMDKSREQLQKIANNSFINCDVRYFNWQLFGEEVGKFDVVLIDPPWRIKGAQQNDSQFMFSNCKFSLQYNTMANSEIGRIPLHLLSHQGFIFLWILNSQLDASLQIMEKWGYELVEEVIWVKLKDQKINLTHGYYFMHSYEVCLVGYKRGKPSPNTQKQDTRKEETRLKVRKGLSWNTVFAEVRQKSQKPQDIYAIIDIMFKGGRKIEIFARNHNLRFGIFSVGNQLGESYDKWLLKLECDECGEILKIGEKRYKSKHKPNYDLCPTCVQTKQKVEFFELSNNVDQNIKHEYISCNHCGSQPIWGIRFQCITCQDFDICQNCFDKNLSKPFHPIEHQFMFLEVPVFGNGFHIHESKCASCYQNPIIGIYFSCMTCKNLNLCQKCYFQRPTGTYNSLMRRHKPEHQLEVILESQIQENKKYECFSCKREVLENCWMCENCYNFFFCESCYSKRHEFKSLYANTHKKYHNLTKIF